MIRKKTIFTSAKVGIPLILGLSMAASSSIAVASPGTIRDNIHHDSSAVSLAQAQAPGRPVTGQTTGAPQKPVRDRVAPTAPPPPGQPNFPKRPPNDPPLKNPQSR